VSGSSPTDSATMSRFCKAVSVLSAASAPTLPAQTSSLSTALAAQPCRTAPAIRCCAIPGLPRSAYIVDLHATASSFQYRTCPVGPGVASPDHAHWTARIPARS